MTKPSDSRVIGWRLLEFWLPIPVAAVAYASLRAGVLRHPWTASQVLVPTSR